MFGELVPATEANVARALERLAQARPSGGTNTYGALAAAYAMVGVETIYFLSDGTPTQGDFTREGDILAEVREWQRTAPKALHTIAFLLGDYRGDDKAAARAFMRELALAGNGTVRVVE